MCKCSLQEAFEQRVAEPCGVCLGCDRSEGNRENGRVGRIPAVPGFRSGLTSDRFFSIQEVKLNVSGQVELLKNLKKLEQILLDHRRDECFSCLSPPVPDLIQAPT